MPTIDPITAKKLAERLKKLYGKVININDEIFGSTPPSLLVTEISYPKVSLGILISELEDSEILDNPIFWSEKELPIEKILELRMKLINARRYVDVYLPKKNDSLYQKILESELSIRSIDVEAKINKVSFADNFSKLLAFYGLKCKLRKYNIVDNPKIPNIVDNLVEENIKAEQAIISLYNYGFSDYYIARLLSVGALGLKPNRKLVPSRWSITAVQSQIIKFLSKVIKFEKTIEKIIVFNYKFYGNDFYGIVFPGNNSFELIEAILPGSAYNLHYNFIIFGRDDISGGYYAAKLSFYEFLKSIRKRANCVIFRIVTKEYIMPLGVWVVREGTKRLFNNPVEKFNDMSEALSFLNRKLEKYNINIQKMKKYSNLLKQKTLAF